MGVNAAGIQALEIGRMAGVEIPVVAAPGQVRVTEPLPTPIGRPVGSCNQTRDGCLPLGTACELLATGRQASSRRSARIGLRAARIVRRFPAARSWRIHGLPIMRPATGWPEGFVPPVCAVSPYHLSRAE